MATDTLQAESAASNNAGNTIAILFARWVDSINAYTSHPGDGDDPEWCKLLDASDDVRVELMQTPAFTIEELAIKAHVCLHHELGGARGRAADFNHGGGVMKDIRPIRGLAADLVRLSPLLSRALRPDAQA